MTKLKDKLLNTLGVFGGILYFSSTIIFLLCPYICSAHLFVVGSCHHYWRFYISYSIWIDLPRSLDMGIG